MAEEYGEEYEEPDMDAELAAIIAETQREHEEHESFAKDEKDDVKKGNSMGSEIGAYDRGDEST